jgi:threonine dehydrogenase-like Zn-dependent dehydrogenase
VLGAGVVGITTAWILQRSGAEIRIADPLEGRRAAAKALLGPSADVVSVTNAGDPLADVVIEATGDPKLLNAAIGCAAFGARIVVASFYGTRRASIDLGDAFHRRRLSLLASQVSTIPPRLAERFDVARRFALVVDLLAEPALDALLAPPTSFEHAPDLFAALDRDADGPPCPVFVYP